MAPSVEVKAVTDTQGVQSPNPLTVNTVEALRTLSGKMVAGTAARANPETYKGIGRHTHKPLAKRWDHYIAPESANRESSRLKSAAQYLSRPGMISLGGGLPSAEYFPFDEMTLKVPRVGHFSEAETHADPMTITAGKYDVREGKSIYDLGIALNYGQGTGAPQLVRFVTEHTEIVHNPPYADWQCNLNIGSTSAWDMVLRTFTSPGQVILSEEYTFSTAVETAKPLGVLTEPVKMDDFGLLPDDLDALLSAWDPAAHDGAPKPFLLYTVPSGQNPTGATQPADRRRAIYAVAQKHDLIIIEDEPYYFLQMVPYTGKDAAAAPPPATHEEFLRSLVPSYLSMDVDGRVVRLDSFSKVLAPGSRCGWITASEQIVERFSRGCDVSTQGSSGFSQLALFKLLDESWGHAGYLDWLVHIRMVYSRRRDIIVGACEDHLPTEIVSWKPPMAGMFHWLKVDWHKHPKADSLTVKQIEERLWMQAIDLGALLIKGSWFRADQGRVQLGEDEELFFRCTFCAAPEDAIVEAIRRFGQAVRTEFGLANGVENGNGHA